jgi:hypothetical protein
MSNNQIPVVKFLFKDDFKALNEALRLAPGYEVDDFGSSNDLATFLSTIPAGLVIASLKTKDDLVQIATYMKLGKKVAKDCTAKVVVINFSGDRNYEKAIAKLGILDLVEPSINTKALKFKLDFWMKSLNASAKLSSKNEQQKVVKSSDQNKQVQEKKADPSVPIWAPPLELEDDIWIIKNESEVKKILSKWLIRIMGPSPYVGQWVELKPGLWRYDIKEFEKEMFVPHEGSWYFSGDQKPDFVWKENMWLITGETFDLFYKDSKHIQSRLNSKAKVLTVCKNSVYAKTKEQIIVQSFDKDLLFKKEAEKLENLEGETKGEKSKKDNLEGKNKTEHLENGNLEGKTKTAADKSGNLKGKIENQNAINQENLDQNANNKKEKTHWNGKNAYEKDGTADFGMKPEGFQDSENLEAPKDNEHQKFYKNHNEAKQFDKSPKEEKEKNQAGFKDKQAEDLKGKSSTDDVEKYYDNSKKNSDRPEKEKRPDEMSGKSETDKLKSHYGRKDQSSSDEANGDAGELAGKSSTDKLAGHYSNPKNAAEKEKKQKQDKEIADIDRAEKDFKNNSAQAGQRSERDQKDKTSREREERERNDSEEYSAKDRHNSPESERAEKARVNKDRGEPVESERAEKERNTKNRSSREESDENIYARDKKERPEEGSSQERDLLERNRGDKKNRNENEKQGRSEKEHAIRKNDDDFEEIDLPESMKSRGGTDKLSSHYSSKKNTAKVDDKESIHDEEESDLSEAKSQKKESSAKEASDDHYTDDLSEGRERKNSKDRNSNSGNDQGADILPLNKAKQEKAIAATKIALNESGLEELTRDAKVLSFIMYKGRKVQCELNDFFDDTIIFLTKEKGIEISSKVTLDLAFKFLERDKKLNMDGNIMTVDGDGEGNHFVTVQLSKENTAAFDVFMRLYETRQSNVNEFLRKVKGL